MKRSMMNEHGEFTNDKESMGISLILNGYSNIASKRNEYSC